jgi:hypothetical protein
MGNTFAPKGLAIGSSPQISPARVFFAARSERDTVAVGLASVMEASVTSSPLSSLTIFV